MITINEQDFSTDDIKLWADKLRPLGFKRLFGGMFSKNSTNKPFSYKQYQFIVSQTLNLSATHPRDSFYSLSFLNTGGAVDKETLLILEKYFDREMKGFSKFSTGGIGVKYMYYIEPNSNSDVEKMFSFIIKKADRIIEGAKKRLKGGSGGGVKRL